MQESSRRLRADMTSIGPVLAFLRESLAERGLAPGRITEIELAAEEALVNIISYAYGQGESGDLELSLKENDDGDLLISFIDWGRPFDPTKAERPDTALPLSERQIGGLGIFLMRRMIDRISHSRESGRNILTFSIPNIVANTGGKPL